MQIFVVSDVQDVVQITSESKILALETVALRGICERRTLLGLAAARRCANSQSRMSLKIIQ